MHYVLGIDQGSTHTRAAVCSPQGKVLGVGRTYGACHAFDGMPRAMNAVNEAATMALNQAGVAVEEVGVLFGGLTGADWPSEYDLLKTNVLSLELCQNVWIKNDSIIALRGGTSANFGVIVIAGSGGNCAIRSPDGEEFIYHYYHDSELQGGGALGRQMLKAIYRAETGREAATCLTARALDKFNLSTVDDLLRADVERRLTADDIKHLAPLVFQAAYEGDRVASSILWTFGTGLAELVTAGLQRFDMTLYLDESLDVEVIEEKFNKNY